MFNVKLSCIQYKITVDPIILIIPGNIGLSKVAHGPFILYLYITKPLVIIFCLGQYLYNLRAFKNDNSLNE